MAALSVEPAYASLTVEHANASSSIYLFGGGLMVEHLKVLISRAPKGPWVTMFLRAFDAVSLYTLFP